MLASLRAPKGVGVTLPCSGMLCVDDDTLTLAPMPDTPAPDQPLHVSTVARLGSTDDDGDGPAVKLVLPHIVTAPLAEVHVTLADDTSHGEALGHRPRSDAWTMPLEHRA
jgi:hypothetical protein